jgi:hypothetical protein
MIRDSGLLQGIDLAKDANNRWTATVSNMWKDSLKTSVIRPRFLFTVNERAAGLPSLSPPAQSSASSHTPQGWDYMIVCSAKEVRCFSNRSKDRIAKVEWKTPVQHVELIERRGQPSKITQFHMVVH